MGPSHMAGLVQYRRVEARARSLDVFSLIIIIKLSCLLNFHKRTSLTRKKGKNKRDQEQNLFLKSISSSISKETKNKISSKQGFNWCKGPKKSKIGTAHQSSNKDASLISNKICKLISRENLQRHVNELAKKLLESEYFVEKLDETKLGVIFFGSVRET